MSPDRSDGRARPPRGPGAARRAVRGGAARGRGSRRPRAAASGSPRAVTVARPVTLPRPVPVRAGHAGRRARSTSRRCAGSSTRCSRGGARPAAGRDGPPVPRDPEQAGPAAADILRDAAQAAQAHAIRPLAAGEEPVTAGRGGDRRRNTGRPRVLGRPRNGWPARTSPSCLRPSCSAVRAHAQLTLAVPLRRSRRPRRTPHGRRTDMRSTLRQARRTGGHRCAGSAVPGPRPRRLVVLCDISGSMEPYARAMIQLLYCAAGGARAEVFSFATRLTRLTGALARSLRPGAGAAAARAGRAGLAGRDQDRRVARASSTTPTAAGAWPGARWS